jgi:hypothetical protein
VVGPRAAVLVPAEESARVPGLWELAQGEPALSELLDTFLRDGLGRLPSFALATWGGDGIDVVIRGPVRVEAGGEEERRHLGDRRAQDGRVLRRGQRVQVGQAEEAVAGLRRPVLRLDEPAQRAEVVAERQPPGGGDEGQVAIHGCSWV